MPDNVCLATDPSTEVCPDFALDIYALLHVDLQRGTDASNDNIVSASLSFGQMSTMNGCNDGTLNRLQQLKLLTRLSSSDEHKKMRPNN